MVLAVVVALATAAGLWIAGVGPVMRSPAPAPDVSQVAAFSYDDYATVLERHVDDDGLVDYAGLEADRAPLDRFVAQLAVAGPASTPEEFENRDAQLAFYINAYNALTLFQVIERMPDFTAPHDEKITFWITTRFALDGDKTNLYDLENELIRPRYEEPRVHFALNCASVGCPRLPREPFVGERLEEQLARETERFLNERRNVVVKDDALALSQIFEWYPEDFPGGVERWVRERRPDLPPAERVTFTPYGWALNAQ